MVGNAVFFSPEFHPSEVRIVSVPFAADGFVDWIAAAVFDESR